MKKYLVIVFLLMLIRLNAASPDSLYIAAGQAYSAGEFELALENYRQILDNGVESADLYYNMGNAAFRSNKLGYSILYYNKALKLKPNHEEALSNLKYVSRYKEDQLESVPVLFLKRWINSLFRLFGIKFWSYLSIILFTMMLSSILIYVFAGRLNFKKAGFFSALFCLAFFSLSFSAALSRHKEITRLDDGIVIAPSIVVKSSPSLSGTDLFILHEGTEVIIDDKVNEWTEIKISDGRVGWIPEEAIAVI